MSKEYCKKFGVHSQPTTSEEMRIHCQRPGNMDEDGNPIYFTEQHHKKECDVNNIVKKYDKTGLIEHIQRFEGEFGDLTGMDFKAMQDKVANAKSRFNLLPADIRARFDNDPQKLISFMDDPRNREEGITLGLIKKSTPEDLDGFGEHVLEQDAWTDEKEREAAESAAENQ